MRDVLFVLQGLSLFLQKRSASIIDSKDRFDTDLKTLTALKSADGTSLALVKKQIVESGRYEGIAVTRTGNDEQRSTECVYSLFKL